MTTPRHPTEALFLKEVANHQMGIPCDDGLRRHLRFRQPNTNQFMFELITWPGYLCICGDMGTYVFSVSGAGADDLFDLFRPPSCFTPLTEGDTLPINPAHWGSRLVSESTFGGGYKTFSADKFREAVKRAFDSFIEGKEEVTPDADADLWNEIESSVLALEYEHEYEAREALLGFHSGEEYCASNYEFGKIFDGSESLDLKDYTWHFIWCCYAIVWGIQKYDEHHESARGPREDPPTNQGDKHGQEACGPGEEAGAQEASQEVLNP